MPKGEIMEIYEEGDCDHFMEAMHFVMLCELEVQGGENENRKQNNGNIDNSVDDGRDSIGGFESDTF